MFSFNNIEKAIQTQEIALQIHGHHCLETGSAERERERKWRGKLVFCLSQATGLMAPNIEIYDESQLLEPIVGTHKTISKESLVECS